MTAPGERTEQNAWSAPPALVVTCWVATVALLAYTVFSHDPIGRLVTGVGTIGIGLFALFATVARPRLLADADGIEIRRLLGRQRLPWGAVRISVSSTRRLGRTVSLLELDTDDEEAVDGGLIVLGWLDLGTEPRSVAEALRTYRY